MISLYNIGESLFSFFIYQGLYGLFAVSIISSVIPIPTEPSLFAAVMETSPYIVILVLVAGSTIGAVIGYAIGKYEIRKVLPFRNKEKEEKVQAWFRRHGAVLLIVSPWIPLVGDLAPMVAGIEKYDFKKFITVIAAAKILKSLAMVYLSIGIIDLFKLI